MDEPPCAELQNYCIKIIEIIILGCALSIVDVNFYLFGVAQ